MLIAGFGRGPGLDDGGLGELKFGGCPWGVGFKELDGLTVEGLMGISDREGVCCFSILVLEPIGVLGRESSKKG